MRILLRRLGLVRALSLAAGAVLMVAAAPGRPAAAMSLIDPGMTRTAKAAPQGLMIQVHGGHGGGGGMHGGGGGWHGGGGGWHGGGYHHGFGYGHFHHRHFFVGGHYPYDYPNYFDYPYGYSYYYHPACRIVWTAYGRRRICYHHRWYGWHHWHHHYYYRHRWHHRHHHW